MRTTKAGLSAHPPEVRVLLALAPVVLTETAAQAAYFGGLKADVITSCCGSLFSARPPAWRRSWRRCPAVRRGSPSTRPSRPSSSPASTSGAGPRAGTSSRAERPGLRRLDRFHHLVHLALHLRVADASLPVLPPAAEYHFIGYPCTRCCSSRHRRPRLGLLHHRRHTPSLRSVLPPLAQRLSLMAIAASSASRPSRRMSCCDAIPPRGY